MTNIHEVTRSQAAVRIREIMHFLSESTLNTDTRSGLSAGARAGLYRYGRQHAVVAPTLASHRRQPGDRASAVVDYRLRSSRDSTGKRYRAGREILQALRRSERKTTKRAGIITTPARVSVFSPGASPSESLAMAALLYPAPLALGKSIGDRFLSVLPVLWSSP